MRFRRPLLLIAVLALGACRAPDEGTTDAGEELSCRNDPRVQAFAPNVTFTSSDGKLRAVILDGTPSPPTRGSNAWRVQLTDGKGAPLPGLSATADAFMPDHGHSATVRPMVSANGEGSYSIAPLSFFMPGVWRVTVAVPSLSNSVELWFCVEG